MRVHQRIPAEEVRGSLLKGGSCIDCGEHTWHARSWRRDDYGDGKVACWCCWRCDCGWEPWRHVHEVAHASEELGLYYRCITAPVIQCFEMDATLRREPIRVLNKWGERLSGRTLTVLSVTASTTQRVDIQQMWRDAEPGQPVDIAIACEGNGVFYLLNAQLEELSMERDIFRGEDTTFLEFVVESETAFSHIPDPNDPQGIFTRLV